ncbi:tubulin-specific chaperone A [Pseudohyphozyma bogoriensis]|nr:tubulin-specific chaperone A [Pseudohyphozyma bogoriensis]
MASRQLTIKTGVVTRLVKEVASYRAEAKMLLGRVEKMEADGEDEYEVRQQRRVLADSEMMIPDSEKRLEKAVRELRELVESSQPELGESEEWAKASKALAVADGAEGAKGEASS